MLHIRVVEPRDLAQTRNIEDAADTAFFALFHIDGWAAAPDGEARAGEPGFLLVASHSPAGDVVGFAHVLELDGEAHLEQLSVHPSHGRTGIGRSLVEAAMSEARRHGFRQMTLRTYADVPWNAPFYASCGFFESLPGAPALAALIDVETSLGLERFGRRIQMTARLDRTD